MADETLPQEPRGIVPSDPGAVPVMQTDGTERRLANEYWDFEEPGLCVDLVSGEHLSPCSTSLTAEAIGRASSGYSMPTASLVDGT